MSMCRKCITFVIHAYIFQCKFPNFCYKCAGVLQWLVIKTSHTKEIRPTPDLDMLWSWSLSEIWGPDTCSREDTKSRHLSSRKNL